MDHLLTAYAIGGGFGIVSGAIGCYAFLLPRLERLKRFDVSDVSPCWSPKGCPFAPRVSEPA